MYIWSIAFGKSYYEYFLPNINNTSIREVIPRAFSGLSTDIVIDASVWEGRWEIAENESIYLKDTKEGHFIKNGVIRCGLKGSDESFALVVDALTSGHSHFVYYRLQTGTLTIGRDLNHPVSYNTSQSLVSSTHAQIEKTPQHTLIRDMSSNGTFVNGLLVASNGQILNFGDVISIFGLKLVYLGEQIAINNPQGVAKITLDMTVPIPSGTKPEHFNPEYYQRSAREYLTLNNDSVKIDGPPTPQRQRKQSLLMTIGPSLTMVIPMTAGMFFMIWVTQNQGGGISPFMFMGLITSLFAATIGVFWAIRHYKQRESIEKEEEQHRQQAYSNYLTRVQQQLESLHATNRNLLNKLYPTPNEVLDFVKADSLRLWERNVNHPDFLTLRIGVGSVPSPNAIDVPRDGFSLIDDSLAGQPSMIKKHYRKITSAPVCVDLVANKLIGVFSRDLEQKHAIGRTLALQLVAAHSYIDVKCVFLHTEAQAERYSFAKWLPHAFYQSLRMVAKERREIDEVLLALAEGVKNSEIYWVVFVADSTLLADRVLPISDNLTTILLYDQMGQIPNECNTLIENCQDGIKYHSLNNTFEAYEQVTPDDVSLAHMRQFAKMLMTKRLQEAKEATQPKERLGFLEMLGVHKIEDLDVYRNWLGSRTHQSMAAIIGYRDQTTPMYLDIHEKSHGPHGLVAGTTGSGKSEILQTYILSMAVNYHPHQVSFVLIDYKGGGMAQSFAQLPHAAGIITNLDGNHVHRALISLKSEVKRRQRMFSQRSIKHIDEYMQLYNRDNLAHPPIPHLIIIADEFAELKKEQGGFIQELVSVARVGRSLGVHLILATQKPSASVDDEIRSNSKFKLCLRVQDKQDSMDMIGKPDAAQITIPGRSYFQVGNDEIFYSFQSGYSGISYQPNPSSFTDLWMIDSLAKPIITTVETAPVDENTVTELDTLVNYLIELVSDKKIVEVAPIWIAPLASRYILPESEDKAAGQLFANIGVGDDPKNQTQPIIGIDLHETGHVAIAGPRGTGKTVLLQTILYSIATRYNPTQVSIYILDMGSRSLSSFVGLPHVGGIAYDTEPEKIDKVINLLRSEIAERKTLFEQHSVGNYLDYQRKQIGLPSLLVVIDNYPNFYDHATRHEETLLSLTREAATYGIYFIMTCLDSTNLRRLKQHISYGIGLGLADRFKYQDTLGVSALDILPSVNIPGRGAVNHQGVAIEFQSYLPLDVHTSYDMSESLLTTFKEIASRWTGPVTKPIPQVPDDLTVETALGSSDWSEILESGQYLPLGYDSTTAKPELFDFHESFCYMIMSERKKGKTTFLKALAKANHRLGFTGYIIDDGELKAFADTEGIVHKSG